VQARWFFVEALGVAHLGDELVGSQQTMTVMLSSTTAAGAPGEARLEILSPEAPGAGPIAKFLEKKGSGIHHVALSVDDVEAAIAHLTAKGVRMIDTAPRPGAHQTRIAFVHPESTGGLLVELVQEHG
jgi:methylmalonyl-CoA/ethylmalonyl-CoA epimerase